MGTTLVPRGAPSDDKYTTRYCYCCPPTTHSALLAGWANTDCSEAKIPWKLPTPRFVKLNSELAHCSPNAKTAAKNHFFVCALFFTTSCF